MSMITVDRLTRRYGDFLAVDNVSFEIAQGEIVGLLGHNGAGKTTIMKMLTGFLEPSSGNIHVDGMEIRSQAAGIKESLGYLPENLPLYPEMTVLDYLEYCAELRDLHGDAKVAAIKQAIEATELQVKALDPINTLSRGYRQRTGVAQSILHQPKVLILDEPTNGLDPSQTQHMRNLILRLAKKATVILSTHIMQEVDAICDRALILVNGKLALDEKLHSLQQSNNLRLASSESPEKIGAQLCSINGIKSVNSVPHAGDDRKYVSILLEDGSDVDQISNEVIRTLVAGNIEVFSISPEQRDLETVFREINEGEGGLVNAA